MQSAKGRLLCAGGVFVVALGLYVWTLAPTVTLVDSGELIVAADGLGIPHPPGFPLYVLLAHATTALPLGTVAQRVNFASALFAALAVALLSAVLAEGLLTAPSGAPRGRRMSKGSGGKKKSAPVREESAAGTMTLRTSVAWVPTVVAALLLAFSQTFWAYATIAEVYTLNTLLLLGVFWMTFRWRRGVVEAESTGTGRDSRSGWLYAAALVFGLALGVHHVTIGLTLPALAVLVYATAGRAFFTSRRFAYAALCACAGLAVYAYLPIAAARDPVLNWGDPRTLQRLWWHVTGRQYHSYFSFSPAALGSEATHFAARLGHEFGPWWLPAAVVLAGLGCAALWRDDRPLFSFLALVVASDLTYALSYIIAEDKDAYYLPTMVAIAIAAGYGAARVLQAAVARSPRTTWLTAVALLLVPAVALVSNVHLNDRSRYFIAHDYVDNILASIAPGGMLLTFDWQVMSPMLYTRSVEAERRDVVVIDVNLLRRSWYFDYLRREYPELIAQTRAQVGAFLEDLLHWEQEPAVYARDPQLTQRIDSRFHEMILAFIRRHLESAPVYITPDIALTRDPDNRWLAQALAAAYQLVPQGLVFQLLADRAFHEPAAPQLVTRGLADGTLEFEADDVVRLKVLPVYVSMLFNRGRYLALHHRHQDAIAAFNQALALDPHFLGARQALSESRKALGGLHPAK